MKEEEKFAKTNRPGQRNLRDQDASCSPSVSHAATRYNTLKLYELIKISKDLSPRKFFEVRPCLVPKIQIPNFFSGICMET